MNVVALLELTAFIAGATATIAIVVGWQNVKSFKRSIAFVLALGITICSFTNFVELSGWVPRHRIDFFEDSLQLWLPMLWWFFFYSSLQITASQKLFRRGARHRALLRAMPDFMFRLSGDGTFLDYYATDPEKLVMPPKHFLNRRLSECLPEDLAGLFQGGVDAAIAQSQIQTIEYKLPPQFDDESQKHYEARVVVSGPNEVLAIVRDVSERKLAEEKLRHSEEYHRTILENLFEGLAIVEADGTIRDTSASITRVNGFTREEMTGTNALDRIHPNERDAAAETLGKIVNSSGKSFESEHRVLHKDGTLRYLEARTVNLIDNPHVRGLVANFRDVTSRRLAEDALRASEGHFRSLMESAKGFVVYRLATDPSSERGGRVVFVSPSIVDLMGVADPNDFSTWFVNIHEDDIERISEAQAVATANSTVFDEEMRVNHPVLNEVRWIRAISNPFSDEHQQTTYFNGVIIDITDRKLAESENQRLREILEATPDFVGMADANGKAIYLNWSAREISGISPRGDIGNYSIANFHPPRITKEIQEKYFPIAIREGVWTGETVFRREDGSEAPVSQVILAHKNPKGEIEFFSTIARDTSELQAAQADREKMIRALEEKNAEMERFVYTVSHDLKSPLITMKGFLGLLKQDLQGLSQEKRDAVDEDIEEISKATEKMKQLLDDLLELSRIGRVSETAQSVSTQTLAKEIVQSFRPAMSEREVTIRIHDELPEVYGDPTRIGEVFQNLIENALKFTNETGAIIEIGAHYKDDHPTFFVADNGVGIGPQYAEKVFDLFEKLDANTEGTGVGLAIVKRIVERHGGRIWIETAGQMKGCTVYFTLPDLPRQEIDYGDRSTAQHLVR